MAEKVVNTTRQTVYYVGETQEYKSIYGYPKRGRYVYRLEPGSMPVGVGNRNGGGGSGNCIGFIKEERIGDENGQVVTTVFYEKNAWRKHGLIRFYASPEALLIGCGMTPVYGLGDKEEATAKIAEISQTAPDKTPPIFLLGDVKPNGMLMLADGSQQIAQLDGNSTTISPIPPALQHALGNLQDVLQQIGSSVEVPRKTPSKKKAKKPAKKASMARGVQTRLTAAAKRKAKKKTKR